MAAIRHDDRAYRRGVVFGFTVAEVVLLLVFCLLLLFVPLLLGENTKASKSPKGSPLHVQLPGPGPGALDGSIGSAKPSQLPAPPAKDPTASPVEAAKPDTPLLGDPTTANNFPAQNDPLP